MADKRIRDPEAKRQALLQAALEEFSEKGVAGARTTAIAERAGVSKQLISHYFGGKQGLYDALIDAWLESESGFADPDLDLATLAGRYVREGAHHRQIHRLLLRASLAEEERAGGLTPDDVEGVRRRQEASEVTSELDPGFLFLAIRAVASMSLFFPNDVRRHLGVDPESEEAVEWHAEQLERLVRLISSDD
jgi:AcrR family transcriptional regulator